MKKSTISLLLLCFTITASQAQNRSIQDLTAELSRKIVPQLNEDFFKDSVAVYVSLIKFDIKNVNHKSLLTKLTINDNPEMFTNQDTLRTIDFSFLLGNKKEMQIIYPVVVLVKNGADRKTPQIIPLKYVKDIINKVFTKVDIDKDAPLYLEPDVITLDKAKYN